MHTDTITLWNFHQKTGKWYPTVIDGCTCRINAASAASVHGGNAKDAFMASIPCTAKQSVTAADGAEKPILGPKAYAASDAPQACITFSPGVDFIAEGASDDAAPICDSDYNGGFYDAMNAENDDVHLITSAVYYGLIPHYEIGGK